MKELNKHIQKLSLRTDYKTTKELLVASQLAFIVSVVLLAFSSLFSYLLYPKAAYFLFFGGLVYEIYFIYLLHETFKKSIKKYKGITKTLLEIMNKLVYVVVFLTIIILILMRRVDVEENKLAILASLVLILVPTMWWDKLLELFKKLNKKLFLLPLLLLVLSSATFAQTNLTSVQQTLTTISSVLQFVMDVSNFLSGIIGWFVSLGLSTGTTYLVLIVLTLITVYVSLKYVRIILKWIIVGMIVWILLTLVGVV